MKKNLLLQEIFKTFLLKKIHFLVFISPFFLFSQTNIEMEKINGIYMIPCKVNGLSLKFVLDTGASDVSISETEALFMLKNGYLKKEDIGEKEYYTLANGNVTEGIIINLKTIEIGGIVLNNTRASIVLEQKAPLLLGQSVLEKLGTYKIDNNKLILEDYKSNKNPSVLDEKNGFKSLKLGTPTSELPPYFQTAECRINESKNTATCIIKDAPDDLKTVFDQKMDFLVATIDLDSQTLSGIQLLKVYRTVVQSKNTSFPVMNDYKYINAMYSKALGVDPKFFSQEFLDSKDIATLEGGYVYWKSNNVLLSVGNVVTEIKMTEDYKPEYIFNLKITYAINENETMDNLFDKF